MTDQNNFDAFKARALAEYNRIIGELAIDMDKKLPFDSVFSPIESQWQWQLESGCNDLLFYYLYHIYYIFGDSQTAKLFLQRAGNIGDDILKRLSAHENIISFWSHQQQYQRQARFRRHVENKNSNGDYDENEPDVKRRAYYDKITLKCKLLANCRDNNDDSSISSETYFSNGLESYECLTADLETACIDALALLKKASEMGHRGAPYYLGLIYLYGLGNGTSYNIPVDKDQGLRFFKIAESRGDIQTIFHLAVLELGDDKFDDARQLFSRISAIELGESNSENENYAIAISRLYIAHDLIKRNVENDLRKSETLCLSVLHFSIRAHTTQNLSKITLADPNWNAISIFSNSYLQDIKHIRDIIIIEAEKREIKERIMSSYAHSLRGAIQEIIYALKDNEEQDNKRSLQIARSMSGLIDTIQILSAKTERLYQEWEDDVCEESNVENVLKNAVFSTLVDLTSRKRLEVLAPHFLSYAIKMGGIPYGTSAKEALRNRSWRKILADYQQKWEREFQELISESLDEQLKWISIHMLPLEVSGFKQSKKLFSAYGLKASVLTIVLTEIIKNAIKYSLPASETPIIIKWNEYSSMSELVCTNPVLHRASEGLPSLGAGSGHDFLKIIAAALKSKFSFEADHASYITKFSFPI